MWTRRCATSRSLSTPTSDVPPLPDEFEVTLLGRGRGESCVVHMGSGRWLIVDSFKEPRASNVTIAGKSRPRTAGLPAAANYLDSMAVAHSAVKVIVLTHFHSDHYEGMLELHSKYLQAQLVVPSAVQHGKFVSIFSERMKSPVSKGLYETGLAIRNADKRSFGPSGVIGGLVRATQGSEITSDATVGLRVMALAPSQRAAVVSATELSTFIDTQPDPALVRNRLQDDNRTSIALHVSACGQTALLCGDVVNEPEQFGWTAIVEHPNHQQLPSADIVKVAHHGSPGAHHDDMWDRFVNAGSPMLVAPFWPSRVPGRSDQQRLNSLGDLFQTGPSGAQLTNEWTITSKQPAQTGVVQARRRAGQPWDIRFTPPAHPVG